MRFETAFPKIPPGLPFPKGGEVIPGNLIVHEVFSPFGKGKL
jgi:hypothetical protein